jgi:hypothetical protein
MFLVFKKSCQSWLIINNLHDLTKTNRKPLLY